MEKILNLIALQTLLCLILPANLIAQSITVFSPANTSACANNIFQIIFPSGVSTSVTVTPSIVFNNGGTSTCSNNQSVQLEYISHSGSGSVSSISSGNTLTFTISNTGTDTVFYRALIDCNVIQTGNGTVNLQQNYGSLIVNGSGNDISVGVGFPKMTDANNNTNKTIGYKTNTKVTFLYKNTGLQPAHFHFEFDPDSANTGYCNQITVVSISYKRNYNGTVYNYTGTDSDTITLNPQDTLYIEPVFYTDECLSCQTQLRAKFTWQCNYPNPGNNVFCSDCSSGLSYSYDVFQNNNVSVLVERLSPVNYNDVIYDLSCMNDTANSTTWSYRITNNGSTGIDSILWTLVQTADNINNGKRHLMLIDKKTLSISKGLNSSCIINTTTRIKTDRLCYNFIDTAIFDCKIDVKDFLIGDTLFVSFKTFRCSEEDNLSLFNLEKSYNQWGFSPCSLKSICGNEVQISNTNAFYSTGTAISGQTAGSGYDVNLKLNFFPSVTDLTYANGIGESALMNVKINTLLNPSKPFVYQLLGCYEQNFLCDTLYGWLRASVVVDTNLILFNPSLDAYLMKVNPNTNDTSYKYANWWYSPFDTLSCRDRNYYYYFNLNEPAMRTFLDSGEFVYKLTVCCGSDASPTPYSSEFHLLANPSRSCFSTTIPSTHDSALIVSDSKQRWLSLSDAANSIAAHCPGCVTPGIIVDYYKMERSTLGLQDTDNDGRADSLNSLINENSNWYLQNGNKIKRKFSGFGDKVNDYLRAHLQPGDSQNEGYTYPQLQARGLRFNSLQLSRTVPMGLDTMRLLPDSLIFYIDTPSTGTCVDCIPFGLPTNSYSTQLKIVATGSDIYNHFLDTLPNSDEYLFKFVDTINGNINNTQFIDPGVTNTFNGFFENQYYRLKVIYNVCGNYMPEGNFTVDDVVRENKIENKMWVSGKVQTTSQVPQNPLDTAQLKDLGYTVYASDIPLGYNYVDTAFINGHLFFCETRGGMHYFVSNVAGNATELINTSGCEKQMNVTAISSLAGGRTIFDVYPFEYRPPILGFDSLTLQVPPGYYISDAAIRNITYFQNNNTSSDTIHLHLTDTVGEVKIAFSDLPVLQCLTQANIPTGSKTFYAGDQLNNRKFEFRLLPLNCIDTLVNHAFDSVAVIQFNNKPVCVPSASCGLANNLFKEIGGLNSMAQIGINPDLQLSNINQTLVTANQDTICWSGVAFTNVSSGNTVTNAENVFVAFPVLPSYINQWHFITNTNDTTQISNQILPITPSLIKGATINGKLCAVVDSCPMVDDTISFNIHYGWNCGNYPASPYDSTEICEYDTLLLSFTRADVEFISNNKEFEYPYTLCDTMYFKGQFTSQQDGFVYPYQVQLHNLVNGLQIVNAYIYNNDSSAYLTPTLTDTIWNISYDSLVNNLSLTNGGINSGGNFWVRFDVVPSCSYAGSAILPDIEVFARTFCNDTISVTSPFISSPVFSWNGQSLCSDCFTLTKTANADTVAIGDTVTFNIQVCSHNAATDSIYLSEILPSPTVFTFISSTPSFPHSNNNFPADTCINYTVTGAYTATGSCPNPDFTNTASLQSGTNAYSDSVCVTVIDPCQPAGTITIPNNEKSSNLPQSSYSNVNFYVAGTFYIDTTFTIFQCTMYVAPAGQIIVQTANGVAGNFIVNESVIQGCSQMWRGINVLSGCTLDVNGQFAERRSIIADADTAVFANHSAHIYVYNSDVVNNLIGIYIPTRANGYNNVALRVEHSKFGLYANQLKPYFNSTIIPSVPVAGIYLNDWNGTIGIFTSLPNQFYNVQNGIFGYRSTFTSKCNYFEKIIPDPDGELAYSYGAVGSLGQPSVRSGDLIVEPVPGGMPTMYNCWRGVYANKSHVNVQSVYMDKMKIGITVTQNNNQQYSTIASNIIKANLVGIQQTNNAGSYNTIESNTITIDTLNANNAATSGIYVSELNNTSTVAYTIYNNSITGSGEFRNGIFIQNVKEPVVYNNFPIKYTSNKTSYGINIISCKGGYFSCNRVEAAYPRLNPSAYTNNGITSKFGGNNEISCNSVDSTFYGFLFDDIQLGTKFLGNDINTHYEGLRLTTSAVIDTQSLAGNKWYGPFASTYGANNLNNAPQNLTQSLFEIDTTSATIFEPSIPFSNIGWFDHKSGSVYDCINNPWCLAMARQSGNNEGLLEKIAKNFTITSDYEDEAKLRAKELLYEKLEEDAQLLSTDVDFQIFKAANDNSAIGKLYDARENLAQITNYDSTFKSTVNTNYEFIQVKKDSINLIDSLEQITPLPNYYTLRNNLLTAISVYESNIANLNFQWDVIASTKINHAEAKNNFVNATQVQQSNDKFVNMVNIEYLRNGISDIENNLIGLTFIAEQCPNVGGSAVFKARALLDLIVLPLYYDDENVCAQYGYRKANLSSIENTLTNQIKIYPNPAANTVSIELIGISSTLLGVEIQDSKGRMIKKENIDYKNSPVEFNISEVVSGFYFLKLQSDKFTYNEKMLIIK
ncbi:MAG TPA: T9SS type A sorting domain-containing protein [Bacteroidia bacterium]|nr:T9SS type A sorting domain-containing protein [Bacteroidia bacterium]HNU34801.1 T9SS type A sorting domain-containing protein [Bacteroidia bacterium]